MPEPIFNPYKKDETQKDQEKKSVEVFKLNAQEKNIQEIFKLSPELKEIACKSLGIENNIRIDIVKEEKDEETGTIYRQLNVYCKGNLIVDTPNQINSNSLLNLIELKEGKMFVGSVLLPEKFQGKGLYKEILQESANILNKKIIDSSLVNEEDQTIATNAKKVWNKLGGEISPNHEAEKLYARYLETIFPESKVRDIVWHGTTSEEEFDNFNVDKESSFGFEKHGGVFFTSMIEDAKTRGSGKDTKLAKKIIPVLIDVKNPLITGQKEFLATIEDTLASGKEEIDVLLANKEVVKRWQEIGWTYRIENDELIVIKPIIKKQAGLMNSEGNLVVDLSQNAMFIGNISQWTTKPLVNMGYDTIIDNNAASSGLNIEIGSNDQGRVLQPKSWFIALKADNIHILGSKKDIEKFKEFVFKEKVKKG